jgi:hypothetical protein
MLYLLCTGALQRVHRLGHGMAMRLQLPGMTADNTSMYVQRAIALAEEVSACRNLMTAVQAKYSTCDPVDEPQVQSVCGVREALCNRKHVLYSTGDIDFGGTQAERNDVTEEWELFFKKIVKTLRL